MTIKELAKIQKYALEETYTEALEKANSAMLYCLSDLTRTQNAYKTPYFIGKNLHKLYK